jgi:hypothetical protein
VDHIELGLPRGSTIGDEPSGGVIMWTVKETVEYVKNAGESWGGIAADLAVVG